MKRLNLFLLLLMVAMVLPATLQAKKIKYGQFVLYDGKAKKDVPTGEGTLTTTAGQTVDVLVGDFAGDGTVTNAQLKFPSGWKFTGTLSYEVEIDGSQVTYTLTDGELYVISASIYESNVHDFTLKVTPEYPIKLVRSPQTNGNILSKAYLKTNIPESEVDDDLISPLTISTIGDKSTSTILADCTILPTSEVKGTSGTGTDVMTNLRSKGFASVTEPWTFLMRPEMVTMTDGTKITKGEYTNEETFLYTADGKKSTVKAFIKQFADGSNIAFADVDTIRNSWVVNYADKSRLKGVFFFNAGKIEISKAKKIWDYSVVDVFKSIMGASNLESLNIRPYTATLTKDDKIIAEYKRGYSSDELKAKEEARAKLMEEGGELVLEASDVVGTWRMSDPMQMANSYSYYILDITEDKKATLQLVADYYDTWNYDGYDPYYVREIFSCKGSYQLMGNKVHFFWQEGAIQESGIDKLYETDKDRYPSKLIIKKAKIQKKHLVNMLTKGLNSPTALSVSDLLLVLGNEGTSEYTLTRMGEETPESMALKAKQKDEEYIHGYTNVTEFKRFYEDGTVTFDQQTGFTIEYANGDKYVGKGHFGLVTSNGIVLQTGFGKRYSEAEGIVNAVLNLPRISDIDVFFYDGVLTHADGSTLSFKKGLTEKQESGLQDNLQEVTYKNKP